MTRLASEPRHSVEALSLLQRSPVAERKSHRDSHAAHDGRRRAERETNSAAKWRRHSEQVSASWCR
jgi:hypothetical protein